MPNQRIVIIGGGFGGAFTAKYLRRFAASDSKIELINSTNYFVFQPLLPEVASGTISAPDAVTPLRYMLPGVRVRMAKVTHVDLDACEIRFLQGTGRFPQTLKYDHLVIAIGQETNLSLAPGFAEHGLCIRNLADAHEIRNHIIQCLEHADVTNYPDVRQRLLTFVVAGGGFSGVETMGEIQEMIRRTLKFYPNISAKDIRAILVQREERILPELSPRLSDYAAKKLKQRNITITYNRSIVSATATDVYLDDGTRIDTATLITTVGNRARSFAESLGVELDRGKIPVDRFLRVAGHENVWSLGDAALVPLPATRDGEVRYAPPTAQFAVREARFVAKNIAATQAGKELHAFDYRPKGSLASLGNYKGVAEVFGIRLSGLPAWIMWRGLYIGMLPGFSTRLRVALNWFFDYFLPRSIVQIANNPGSATIYRCYAKGDVICRPGQIIDGLYSVTSGRLESRIPGAGQQDLVRVLGPGDHWGERSLSSPTEATGTLKALEDTRVMVLQRVDFQNLSAAFPILNEYFDTIGDEIDAPSLPRETP